MSFFTKFIEKRKKRKLASSIEKIANKNTTQDSRQGAIEYLSKQTGFDAIYGLLQRFNYTLDKSIVDTDEKEKVEEYVLAFGNEAVHPVQKYIIKNETIAWPLRILRKLIREGEYIQFLVDNLKTEETIFDHKAEEKKIDIIHHLEEFKNNSVFEKVCALIGDHDERIRLAALSVLEKQDNEAIREELLTILIKPEESRRITSKIIDIFKHTNWDIKGFRKSVEEILPDGFYVTKEGYIRERGR